jgi:probable rRNA maturation factor
MRIGLSNLQKRVMINEARLKKTAKKILGYLGRNNNIELSIVLVDNRRMFLLNKKFRKINKSTDVLAFSMKEGEDSDINPALLGDVIISVDAARRCAKQFEITEDEEICRYLTHGILHLLGYDDQKMHERKVMKEKEEEILKYLLG